MRLLVCGDRFWTDYSIVLKVIRLINDSHGISTLIEGECRGADILAKGAAKELGIPVEAYPVTSNEWKVLGKVAGPLRNAKMLKLGKPDMGIAFHNSLHTSKGAKDMIRKMEKDSKKVIKVRSTDLGVKPWPISHLDSITLDNFQMTSITLDNLVIKGYVIYSTELGIYLGSALGLGFWSKLDPAGQNSAVVFNSKDAANEYLDSLPASIKDITLIEVYPDIFPNYASIKACVDAGLPSWD